MHIMAADLEGAYALEDVVNTETGEVIVEANTEIVAGKLQQIVEEGGVTGVNHESGYTDNPNVIDRVSVPIARGMLAVLGMIKNFSPIDSLSSGRTISWGELAKAVFQIWVVMGGLLRVAESKAKANRRRRRVVAR